MLAEVAWVYTQRGLEQQSPVAAGYKMGPALPGGVGVISASISGGLASGIWSARSSSPREPRLRLRFPAFWGSDWRTSWRIITTLTFPAVPTEYSRTLCSISWSGCESNISQTKNGGLSINKSRSEPSGCRWSGGFTVGRRPGSETLALAPETMRKRGLFSVNALLSALR